VEDFYDNELIDNYLKKKEISDFKIEDIRLQIINTQYPVPSTLYQATNEKLLTKLSIK